MRSAESSRASIHCRRKTPEPTTHVRASKAITADDTRTRDRFASQCPLALIGEDIIVALAVVVCGCAIDDDAIQVGSQRLQSRRRGLNTRKLADVRSNRQDSAI